MEEEAPLRVTDKRGLRRAEEADGVELSEEQLDQLREQAANDDSTPPNPNARMMMTAFLVCVDHLGNVQATGDINTVNDMVLSRQATLADMYSAAGHIQKDISVQESVVRVLGAMQQQAMAAREQMAAAQVHQEIKNGLLR